MTASASVLGYQSQRKLDRFQNGNLLEVHNENGATIEFRFSSDNGATWTKSTVTIGSVTGTVSIFIDLDDFIHIAYETDADIWYNRATPNAGRTDLTLGTTVSITGNARSDCYAPDVVAFRTPGSSPTEWEVVLVWGVNGATYNNTAYVRGHINNAGTVTSWNKDGAPLVFGDGVAPAYLGSYGINLNTFPSVDFHHTGDGKTVQGGTPHIYVGWSAASAANGIRFRKAVFSAGAWTWNAERTILTDAYIDNASYRWVNCLFDGTRVLIGGMGWGSTVGHFFLCERDVADTTTTTRFNQTTASGNTTDQNMPEDGSMTYSIAGDVYFFGRYNTTSAQLLGYRKYNRGTNTVETVVTAAVMANTGGALPHTAKRGNSFGRIEWLYVFGNQNPYSIQYDRVLTNQNPNTPTNLQRQAPNIDTTPVFQADISDPDTGQQIKARFTIYQSDGVTVVGTVDSSFRTGAGSVTAEYATPLGVGTYKVSAIAIDDQGAQSAATSQVTFYVTTTVAKDSTLLWNVKQAVAKDSTLLWNVQVSNQVTVNLIWHTKVLFQKEFTLMWGQRDPWTPVPETDNHEIWTEVSS